MDLPAPVLQSVEAGWVAPTVAVILAILFLVGPVVLHFAQKSHNRLPTVETRFKGPGDFVPGEAFATTVIAIMERELDSVTGWRPNDFVLWGPTLWADNNSNRQLGIIQALRESMRVFKDHLTKVSSDEFDRNLVEADTAFRNDAHKFWLPSAEGKFRSGVDYLKKYVAGLHASPQTSKPINQRNVELIRLFQVWTDLLGDAHSNLYRPAKSWLQIDDQYYHAQGFAHVMYQLILAIRMEYAKELEPRPVLQTLFSEVEAALAPAAVMKPLIVLNGGPEGLLANHRRNLDTYINEARQKMYSIREELEK
jgi:hypothetical protein